MAGGGDINIYQSVAQTGKCKTEEVRTEVMVCLKGSEN